MPAAMTEPRPDAAPSLVRLLGSALVAYVLLPLVLLGALEGIMRRFWPLPSRDLSPDMVQMLPDGFYFNRPGFTGTAYGVPVSIDPLGLRTTVGAPSDSTLPRLLLIGDSVVFGVGLSDAEAPGSVLQSEIGHGSHVLNSGVIGYSSAQQYRLLREKGSLWRPDILVLVYCLNDPVSTPNPTGMLVETRRLPWYKRSIVWLRTHSVLVQRVLSAAAQGGLVPTSLDWVKRLHQGSNWAVSVRSLDAINQWAQAHRVPLMLVVVPLREQVQDPHTSNLPQQELRAWANRSSVPILDLRPNMLPGDFLDGDDTHLNAAGVRKAMALLSDRVFPILHSLPQSSNL